MARTGDNVLPHALSNAVREEDFESAHQAAVRLILAGNGLIHSVQKSGDQHLIQWLRDFCRALDAGRGAIEKVSHWHCAVSTGPFGTPPESEATAHNLAWRFAHRLWLGIRNLLFTELVLAEGEAADEPEDGPGFEFCESLIAAYTAKIVELVRVESLFDYDFFRPHLQLEKAKGVVRFQGDMAIPSEQLAGVDARTSTPQIANSRQQLELETDASTESYQQACVRAEIMRKDEIERLRKADPQIQRLDLSVTLLGIARQLSGYEQIDDGFLGIRGMFINPKTREAVRGVHSAIDNIRDIKVSIAGAMIVARAHPDTPLLRSVKETLILVDDAINDADYLAESAVAGGFLEEALCTCRDGARRAFERCHERLLDLGAKLNTSVRTHLDAPSDGVHPEMDKGDLKFSRPRANGWDAPDSSNKVSSPTTAAVYRKYIHPNGTLPPPEFCEKVGNETRTCGPVTGNMRELGATVGAGKLPGTANGLINRFQNEVQKEKSAIWVREAGGKNLEAFYRSLRKFEAAKTIVETLREERRHSKQN